MNTTSHPAASLSPIEALRLDYATPGGFQPGYMDLPGFHMWHLRKPIPGHPVNSTVSTKTLDAALVALHPATTAAQKVAEFDGLRATVETPPQFKAFLRSLRTQSPIEFSVHLDSTGEQVTVSATSVEGEPGSCAICGGVEITSIRNAKGEEVDVSNDELRWLHSEAEKRV